MSSHADTIATYDRSARALAEYFAGIGPRIADIERALRLAGAGPHARVVEVGCGDGRDAVEIVRRTSFYEGFDPSDGLLQIARERLPHISFVRADAHSYSYPKDLDVVFAFASLLHTPQEELGTALAAMERSLRSGGIAYLSLKERPAYMEEMKADQYGKRLFYFYTPDLVTELAGSLVPVHQDRQRIGNTDWFTLALQKP